MLRKIRNIGETVAERLEEIGVKNRENLESIGPVSAYLEMKCKNPGIALPRCYYLYSLEGALRNVHWDKLPLSIKQKLSAEAGLEDL